MCGAWSVQLYLLLLFLRVLLSWFPAFNWERQPWLTLRQARPCLPCKTQMQMCVESISVHCGGVAGKFAWARVEPWRIAGKLLLWMLAQHLPNTLVFVSILCCARTSWGS